MSDRSKVEVGDEVMLSTGGRRATGKVIKVGRTLIHIQGPGGKVHKLDRARQRDTEGYVWYRTLAQEEHSQRYTDAIVKLRERGLTVQSGQTIRYTTERLEALISLIDSWEVDDGK